MPDSGQYREYFSEHVGVTRGPMEGKSKGRSETPGPIIPKVSIPELLDGQMRLQLILRPLQMLHA